MNNRIMAMLCALVAAMFISIVPVKAEAAGAGSCSTHKATDLKWHHDADEHWQTCQKCGDVTVARTPHNDLVYGQKDATTHTVKCRTCGYTGSEGHVPVSDGKNCRCDKCNIIIDHTLEWNKNGTDNHKQECKICDYETTAAAHEWVATNNENGTHTKICNVCGKSVTEGHNDVDTDKDCACDACGAADVKHSPVVIEAKDATCTETGNIAHRKCEFCGKLFAETAGTELKAEDVVTKAKNHQAKTEWKVTEDGKHYHECARKGCEEKLELAAHTPGSYGHDIDGHWAICTVCNNWLEETEHQWTYESIGNNQHKVKCSVCNINESTKACKDENKDCFCDDCKGLMNHNRADMEYLCYAPTCTESGWYENWLCKTCNTRFDTNYAVVEESAKFRPATGHALNARWEETEDGAEHYQWCANNCGTKLHANGEAAVVGTEAHSHGQWNVGGDAHEEICAVCEQTYGYEKHAYTEVELAAASSTGTQRHKKVCECGAYELKMCVFDENCVCKVCGAEKVHDIAALSTVPGAKEATCTVAGVKTHYECKTCENIFFYEGGKCVKITEKDTVIPALGHKWTPSLTMDDVDGKHVMTCSNVVNGVQCNKATVMNHYTEDGDCYCDVAGCKVIAHSHKFVQVTGKAATCTESGIEAYNKYEGCGKMFDLNGNEISAPVTIAPLGHGDSDKWVPGENGQHVKICPDCGEIIASAEHNFSAGMICPDCGANESLTRVAAKAATCYEDGNIEYWYAVNGDKFADADGIRKLGAGEEKIEKIEHTLVWEPMADGQRHQQVCKNKGCTKQPIIEYHSTANGCYCSVCEAVKGNHRLTAHVMEAATCAKAGYQAYYECSCGKLYDMGYNEIEAPTAIAQLKHDYADAKVQKDAKEGKHYVACNDCGNKVYENHVMDVEDPLKGNYHQYICECGELEIEQHYDKNGDNVCDACDHNLGSTATAVEQHDNVTVKTGNASTVDSTKSWWQNWLEVLTPSNSGGTASSNEKTVANSSTNSNTTTGSSANTGSTSASGSTSTSGSTSASTGTASGSTADSGSAATQNNVIVQFFQWLFSFFGF